MELILSHSSDFLLSSEKKLEKQTWLLEMLHKDLKMWLKATEKPWKRALQHAVHTISQKKRFKMLFPKQQGNSSHDYIRITFFP